ncbi:hypothetical protein FA10DRAFT_298233 [Acaromyces ingoldii]|uniref:1-phosphatidylinositol 4-kinase n=1 Tax=Acaromyces ingoldii TaxID=215250 RepID=A0A316YU64_9BASI|nr:hypothetical protein FA10DRAFT_298233 [Acaromyces ingoldii]PWN92771.1 hypothetical protein FA10DRAFT_298233 [Acaromyces ingoldii]
MDGLDLNTHQLILNDLALNLAEGAASGHLSAKDVALFGSGASTSAKTSKTGKVLTASAVKTQIALALFASSISSASRSSADVHDEAVDEHLTPVLNDVLNAANELVSVDIEEHLANSDWPLADQLAFAITSSLVRIAKNAPQHRSRCLTAVVGLGDRLAQVLSAQSGDAHAVATRITPLFHGYYRALGSIAFPWSIAEFAQLATALNPLGSTSQTVRRLNEALLVLPEQAAALAQADRATRRKAKKPTVRPRDDDDDDDARSVGSVDTFFSGDEDVEDQQDEGNARLGGFTHTGDEDAYDYRLAVLTHYRRAGRPLSGHFVLCAAIEALSSVLSQALAVMAKPPIKNFADYQKLALDQDYIDPARVSNAERFDLAVDEEKDEAIGLEPVRKAWKSLLRYPVKAGEDAHANGTANGIANGTAAQTTSSSRFLSAIPGIGGNNSAAFGTDSGSPTPASLRSGLSSAVHLASRAYHDLQRFVENEGAKRGELFVDVYVLEILSESLKLGALASVAQSQATGSPIESHTLVRIRSLLSDAAIVYEPLLQGAALQSASLLVRNYPKIAMVMTTQLRRFVTAPLAMFSIVEPHGGLAPSPVLASAAKCLATCTSLAPGDDLVVSTMYTLLNYLGKDTSTGGFGAGGLAGGAMSVRSGVSRAVTGRDFMSMKPSNTQALFASRSDDQKRVIHANTIAIVAQLALEVGKPEVIALAISMLLQRLRTADDIGEAAILNNVVPLALAAPRQSYVDVIRAFSNVSRSALTGGAGRRADSSVQVAQLKLARGLGRLDEGQGVALEKKQQQQQAQTSDGQDADTDDRISGRKELFVVELLQLFVEKGTQLEGSTASKVVSSEEKAELLADLQGLLPPLAALLSHKDINPQLNPTLEMVSLFRNMWFLAVIFGLAKPQNKARIRNSPSNATDTSHITEALGIISLKTPTLVPETAVNYIESELKFNSVLRREFSSSALEGQRKSLATLIPSHASEVRSFGFPQVTFLNTIYSLECTRSSMGMPSMVLWYFVNEGLNNSSLVGSMEAIADKVIASYMEDLSYQVNDHSLDPRVTMEVRNLVLGSCHRVEKVRTVSRRFLDRLINAYPSLLCDQDLVVTMLEMLTLLRQGCEGQYRDEYAPVYHFKSEKADVAFVLSDSYAQRNEILSSFLQRTRNYMGLLLARAPVELQGILQRYLGTFDDALLPGTAELGKSVALEVARALPTQGGQEGFLPELGGWRADSSSAFVGELSAKSTYLGEMTGTHLALTKGLVELQQDPISNFSDKSVADCKKQLARVSADLADPHARPLPFAELRRLLYRSAALAVALPDVHYDLLHYLVSIPIRVFTPAAITTASHVWTWVIGERPLFETKIMVEISLGWATTIKGRKGLFSPSMTNEHPLLRKTEMSPTDRVEMNRERERAQRLFSPHLTLIQLVSSRFQAFRYRDPSMVLALVRLIQRSAIATDKMSTHPLSREVRFALIVFGFRVIQSSRLDGLVEYQLRLALYKVAFAWFETTPQWSFGSNRLQVAAEMQLMRELLDVLKADTFKAQYAITSFPPSMEGVRMPGHQTVPQAVDSFAGRRALLQLLVEDELSRFSVWNNPINEPSRGQDYNGELTRTINDTKWADMIRLAWRINATVAVQMTRRFKAHAARREAGRLVRAQPYKVVDCPEAFELLAEEHMSLCTKEGTDLKWLHYWAAITPVQAVELFQKEYGNSAMLLQYAMGALEHHPVELTFFYIPQIVQALRDDEYGYVEQFIFETSKISQLFCHQIIWNMKANSYKDDDAEVPDPMKPTLDRMVDLIVAALSGEAQDFYDREFGFFNEVTSISGKLKPYIKKSKAEKKAKIDEEMAKIKVDPGVYLPSNPDGVVVDLARKSGRPLQSHAKAPFMATFKVHRDVKSDEDGDAEEPADGKVDSKGIDVWQAAIFKVGDDCRQDVLALQAVAMLKNIWQSVGLDLYLNPYRVTATGPGCGVIDVVPNATSRDEMGRAQINDLNSFFLTKYGNADSIAYQQARLHFVRSMAGYSLACYLLQIKDRHNGNIMIDGDGHIIHIDFGFLFMIGPGGMKFEPNSFKLSLEFVEVMGGPDSQGFKYFCELVVKGFLALRPYAQDIMSLCSLMYGTDLPSFKGPQTFVELHDRFKLDLNERQAASHAQDLVKDAYGNGRSVFYDQFQAWQNGIPYAK